MKKLYIFQTNENVISLKKSATISKSKNNELVMIEKPSIFLIYYLYFDKLEIF